MQKLLAIPRAILRKTLRINDKIDITLGGPRFSIPKTLGDEPQETRRRREPSTAPFYEMEAQKLWGYYYGYRGSKEHHHDMLYGELTAFENPDLHAVSTNSVKIEDVRVSLRAVPYRLPSKLHAHREAAVSYFQELGKINQLDDGTWENNKAIRVANLGNGHFEVEFATYFDQVGTNLTLDWASGALPDKSPTLRSGLEFPEAGKLVSLASSILANTLGTAVVVFDEKLTRTLLRMRSANMASIAKKGLHPTVSGVLEPEPGIRPGNYDAGFFEYGTRYEIQRETGLQPDQYLLFPLAFARELPRGGKPQLFYAAILLVDDATFEQSCLTAPEAREFEALPEGASFGQSGLDAREAFTYEGYAAQLLAEDFVEANRTRLAELISAKAA